MGARGEVRIGWVLARAEWPDNPTFGDIALNALIERPERRSRSSPQKPIWRPGMRKKYARSKARKDAKKGDSFRIARHPTETPSVGLQPGTA
jgi:hypothetical protein